MKKLLTTILSIAVSAAVLYAIPASPLPFQYTQPDGSVITLQKHGDEFFSWTTTTDGEVVELSEDGFWKPSAINFEMRRRGLAAREEINMLRARDLESRALKYGKRGTQNTDPMTHGERRIPVVLVEFSDRKFSISNPKSKFDALLNQEGYSSNSATGSVRDFYVDNSNGVFIPVFDVFDVVTLTNTCEYYAYNQTQRASVALTEAVAALNSTVDFSKYDYDNDGYIDMILMYYAGYNQAEGAANTIWPHQGYVNGSSRYDNKRLYRYFCTSELQGTRGSTMCGIGTTCHEFGHSIGLPDFYDTDYEENGQTHAVSVLSTMCSGSYLNSSRTPPYFNSEERILLGWMADSDVKELPTGSVSLGSVETEHAYRSYTDTEGEYFLLEYRRNVGWDRALVQYVGSGLTVFHVDKSTTRSVGGHTPYEHWQHWEYYNKINAYGSHPCYYAIPPRNQSNLNYSDYDLTFPGSSRIRTYEPVDWENNKTGVTLSNITVSGEVVNMSVESTRPRHDPPEENVSDFAYLGFTSILPMDSYKAGQTFEFVLDCLSANAPESVVWYYDGVKNTAGSVTLKAGNHTVKAVLNYTDGREETIELPITVK